MRSFIERYYRLGLAAIPCCAPVPGGGCSAPWHAVDGQPCSRPGKRPLVCDYRRLGAGLPPLDRLLEVFEREAARVGGETNIAVVIRPPLIVIDADSPPADTEVEQAMGDVALGPTRAARPGRGRQFYMKQPPGGSLKTASHLGVSQAIDVRVGGDLCIVPPSRHATGFVYGWERAPGEVAVPVMPEALAALLRPPARPVRPAAPGGPAAPGQPLDEHLTERELAARMLRAAHYVLALPPSISGAGGHHALWRAALAVAVGFAIPRRQAIAILMHWFNPACVPSWSPREIEQKVDAVLAKATAPRGWLLRPAAPITSPEVIDLGLGEEDER